MTRGVVRAAVLLLPLLGVAALVHARRTENGWRADQLSDAGAAVVSLAGGPWADHRVELPGLPRLGSRVTGSRRWAGYDVRDGYYTVTEIAPDSRTGRALWVGNPTLT